jgi:NAD(P)H-dependent FMN reductase
MACRLLLISGSLRVGSTNSAALRTIDGLLTPGVQTTLYSRLVDLPPFNPDDDAEPLPAEVAALRAAIHASAAIVFSAPEYAGALPGVLKNLLDWTIGDDQPGSIYNKPVSWINTSPRGAAGAHAELRTVLGYAHADIIDSACVHVPVTNTMIGTDGTITDAATRRELARAVETLVATLPACNQNEFDSALV